MTNKRKEQLMALEVALGYVLTAENMNDTSDCALQCDWEKVIEDMRTLIKTEYCEYE